MANIISAGIGTENAVFPEELTRELFNGVAGKSALARVSRQRPISFVGNTDFVFSMDSEADIVAENGAKSNGGGAFTPVHIVPVKFEYGTRVSDEFIYASEEQRLETLRTFMEGAARKFARGFDIAAIHGLNPRTMTASAVVGDNHFDSKAAATPMVPTEGFDVALSNAIAWVNNEGYEVTGLALAPMFSAGIGAPNSKGIVNYPELSFGANPETFRGMALGVSNTVSMAAEGVTTLDGAIVGDFENAFRWGYARDIDFEVIRYGNPDNNTTLGDLRGHNQVYLRCEAYIGWGILNANSFNRVTVTTA